MARMVDLIREGVAPASMRRRAAQGGLSLPPCEAIEILVALVADRELGEEAERTLEGWDETALVEVAGNPEMPPEALLYMLKLHGERPAIVAALCENPSLDLSELETIASHASPEVLRAMMGCGRVRNSSRLLELMAGNSSAAQAKPHLEQWLTEAQAEDADEIAEAFIAKHAEELSSEDAKPFELVASSDGEEDALDKVLTLAKSGEITGADPEVRKQVSIFQKIALMRVGERIKLAMRGNREERMVLVRDRSKLVSLAVLESPKVTETEMESFAAMKNIQESVLRAISTKRSFIKNYSVLRALANNPKTPMDVVLPLLAHLLLQDQRALAVNKNVNETVRKMALRLWRMKSERKKE